MDVETRAAPPAVEIDYEAIRLEKVVTALRSTEKVTVDGHLEEPAWKLALPATDFITALPRPGEPASDRTEVRFIYDDDNLYVGFICFDSDPSDNVVVLREDFTSKESDGVAMVLDSLHDRRSGFQFGTNPAGAKRDSQITNNSQFNNDWDAVWDVKVSTNSEGWIAEFAIPFKTLRFSQSPIQEWGVEPEPFHCSQKRREFLVTDSNSIQHEQDFPGRYAERPRGHPSGPQFQGQAVRDGRDHAGSCPRTVRS